MSKVIHYDDNIFFAAMLIKSLKSALSLEIDPEYFCEKYLADITFLNKLLSDLYQSLKENTRLIERPDNLKNLLLAIRNYSELVDSLTDGPTPIARVLAPKAIELHSFQESRNSDSSEIMSMLRQAGELVGDIDVVSQDEMSELLRFNSGD